MKYLLILLVISSAILLSGCSSKQTYEDGYDEGYEDGYDDGRADLMNK